MKPHKIILALALAAYAQYQRPLLLDGEGNVFMPQNPDHASHGFTEDVYGFDGRQLRKIAKGELAKLPRHVDGRQLIGAGALVVQADPEPEAQEAEAPVADTHTTEAPVADTHTTEAPVADTYTTEAPVADTPAKPKAKQKAKQP